MMEKIYLKNAVSGEKINMHFEKNKNAVWKKDQDLQSTKTIENL